MTIGAPDDPAEIDALLRRYALEADRIGKAFGERHHLHHTDIQALVIIMDAEATGHPITPAGLAEVLSMSTGSTSALVDRLERTGHVQRVRESSDRRRVHLHYTPDAMRLGVEFFGPLGERAAAVRARFTDDELATVARFLGEMTEAMYQHRRSLGSTGG